jgi:hypothetical protein
MADRCPPLAEGWGLTVLEANALGTPAMGYDVPGLRDAVRHGQTGWLVPPADGLSTAIEGALEELENPARRQFLAEQARAWAANFTWDASAERFARAVLSEIKHRKRGKISRRSVDLATVATWSSGDLDDLERRLRKELRVTDIISRDVDGLTVLLTGCDEIDAANALRRAQVAPVKLRLATTTSVLCGTARDDSV